jgi:hypothetical protein
VQRFAVVEPYFPVFFFLQHAGRLIELFVSVPLVEAPCLNEKGLGAQSLDGEKFAFMLANSVSHVLM